MMNTLCAWCIEEAGEQPSEDDSHGICTDHAEQVMMTYHWNSLQRVPSYVEQQAAAFADEED